MGVFKITILRGMGIRLLFVVIMSLHEAQEAGGDPPRKTIIHRG